MNKYKITVEHDGGSLALTVYGSNYQSAITQVCNAEKCPETAIKSVEMQTNKDDTDFKFLERLYDISRRGKKLLSNHESDNRIFQATITMIYNDYVKDNNLPENFDIVDLITYLKNK